MSLETIPAPAQLEYEEFDGIVSNAPQMREFHELLRRVARSEASILIRGESGTGKELAAAAIHAHSRRRHATFRAINCATLTPELAASELFGHVRGAFTGAIRDRSGLFAAADGGTVFLDEIAELSTDIQARLLRVLQERNFVPVGATQPVKVDVRLLAATNKSLREEVERGRFREDLMYRVRVVPLFLPPLVERSGDVETLAWYFIAEFNARAEAAEAEAARGLDDEDPPLRRIEALSPAAHARLLAYQWPGNVRELRNVIEYAFAIGEGPVLEVGELPPELRGEAPPRTSRVVRATMAPEDDERARILEALRIAGGLKSQAAELLGVSRTTLWRKMRELEIEG